MKEKALTRFLSPITTIISILSAIVYITFYATTLDKRITVTENNQTEFNDRLDLLRSDIRTINDFQSKEQAQFHADVYSQMNRMGNRIEKIYSILIGAKEHEES